MSTSAQFRGGLQHFFDKPSWETVKVMAPILFQDDFVGAGSLAIPAAGSAESGVSWVKKIVGAAPPTVAGLSSNAGGVIECALTSASQKQDAVAYFDDNKCFDVSKGLAWEARIKLAVLPSASGVQAVWGLANSWIDGPDSNTYYLQVGATANGTLLARSQDGVTQNSSSLGVTLTTADWAIVRVDAFDLTNVRFWVDGVDCTPSTAIAFAATGANAILQPYFGVYKPSGTGVASLDVDYIRVWGNRS